MMRAPAPAARAEGTSSRLYMVMGETAEVVAKRYGISRQAQDDKSQQRVARAQRDGFFRQGAPIRVTRGAGEEWVREEGDRGGRADSRGTTVKVPSKFPPHFKRTAATAGSPPGTTQLSDGASATVVMSRERADTLGIPYKLVFRGFQVAGCDPTKWASGRSSPYPGFFTAPASPSMTSTSEIERGLRRPGALLPRSPRHRSRKTECERRVDSHRPSVRHDRVAPRRHTRE